LSATEFSKRPAPTLQRVAFETSRLAEFCSEKELVAQTGHPIEDWPLVVLKELVDNALDACEEAEISPEIDIRVSTETGEIVVTDNGPGLPTDAIQGILDYAVRASSREAYVSPTRGAQGNASKCVIAMGFVLDGTRGVTVIEAHGRAHRIIFEMDRVRREPRVLHEISPSLVQKGSRITVRWPDSARSILEDAKPRFVQTAGNFAVFNPHVKLLCDWNGHRLDLPATNPSFRKWRACDPTSAYWYDPGRFGRYMAAHIARDEDQGRDGRTVREFISELRGLARSDKQKAVLAEAAASGVSLAEFFGGSEVAISRLLTAYQKQTKPVDPKDLGLIGADHLGQCCMVLGGEPGSFKYKKHVGVTLDGLPYVVEAAFAYCPDGDDCSTIITGVNFSVGIRNPFQRIGFSDSLSSVLEREMAGAKEPVVFVLHYTCPRVAYLDRGKSSINLPSNVSRVIRELVESVTEDWCRQRKREEREASRALERRDRLGSTRRVTIKDAAWEVMDEAYLKASGDGKLPAKARQIMYAARPKILAFTGRDTLDDKYFTQTLMVDYIDAHPGRCATWNVVWDARGTFSEPHTNREVPLGTLEVQQYLGDRPAFVTPTSVTFADHFPTSGPENRFDTIFYVEKEGFEPLLKAARMAERFDVAIMTTKGMSVTAARLLLDRLTQTGYVRRILALHDFDVSGFSIFGTLGTSNRRYKFESVVPLIDLGLRLDNVQAMNLESEPVVVRGNWARRAATLRKHGATYDEIAFLRDRRVELNAMTSRQIVDFIEAKFAEHGVTKLIPDAETITRHALRVRENQLMEEAIAKAAEQIAEQIAETTLPADLPQLIKDKLNERPSLSWDQALASTIRDDNRD
jgi:hypothetical protein